MKWFPQIVFGTKSQAIATQKENQIHNNAQTYLNDNPFNGKTHQPNE